MTLTTEQFLKEVATHGMQVIRDDGVNRHIRFKRPNTMGMHFDLITWPGYLCYTGDMGTYVFRRLEDMFQFFRTSYPTDEVFKHLDMRYWAEKVEAQDKADGITEFCYETYNASIWRCFEEASEDWSDERKASMKKIIEEQLICRSYDCQETAMAAMSCFDRSDLGLDDFPPSMYQVYSHRFQWCCYAMRWGIGQYDKTKEAKEVVA